MPPLWRALLRFAAEWVVLIVLGGALGIGTAEAVQAGWMSEQTVVIVYGTLIAVGIAFVAWGVRDAILIPWDDWDDGPDPPTDSSPPVL